MCYDWEICKLMEMREAARREREKAEAQKRQEANIAPPKPAEPAPSRGQRTRSRLKRVASPKGIRCGKRGFPF
jgi:hypothetical protein